MDVAELRDLWPVPGPWVVRPGTAGTNNRSYVVDTSVGAYYLRVYQNIADEARLRYEHALLTGLQQVGLSFAVPAPCATRTGATYARLRSAGSALAALCPLIPGRHPVRQDPGEVTLCGEALGELDAALAGVTLALPAGTRTSFADLAHVHPLMPDPQALPSDLPLDDERRARVRSVVAQVGAETPALFAALPRQLIHSDYGASNILMAPGRVTGVLDFEFAGPDPRVMDFAVGLTMFMSYGADSGAQLALGAAFSAGYLAHCPLTPEERAAVVPLMRLYRTVSLVHRAGRYRQGVATTAEVMERVDALLRLDTWLTRHKRDLAHLLRRPAS